MDQDDHDPPVLPTDEATNEKLDRARRRLLKAAVYATPLVLGMISLQQARAQKKSCNPMNCRPLRCHPVRCRPGRG
jgi:hypothetical protein